MCALFTQSPESLDGLTSLIRAVCVVQPSHFQPQSPNHFSIATYSAFELHTSQNNSALRYATLP